MSSLPVCVEQAIKQSDLKKLKAFRKIMWHCNLALWNKIRVSTDATTSVLFSKKGAQSWSVDHSKVLSRRGVMERYHGRPNLTTLWIAPRQQGVGGSLQVGWSHCRGSYIARLDADDEATGWNVHEIWAKYGKVHDIPCIKQHQARKVMVFCSFIYCIHLYSYFFTFGSQYFRKLKVEIPSWLVGC